MCPINDQTVQELLGEYKNSIKDNEKYYISEENIYGIKKENVTFFNKSYTAYIYYDQERALEEKTAIHSKLNSIESKFKKTKIYSKKLVNMFGNYFLIGKIGRSKKARFTYKRKVEEIQKCIDLAGMFIVVSNTKLDANEMISIVRKRDKCEKAFKRIKKHFELKVPQIHNEKTFIGKMFVAFLANNIVETYRYLIKEYLNKTSSETTFTSLFELSKVMIYRSNNNWNLKYALTKKLKQYLIY